jgi:hypothetical protein
MFLSFLASSDLYRRLISVVLVAGSFSWINLLADLIVPGECT